MAIRNKTRYALLGVISMNPCTGYDIKKFCDQTIAHFWNENFGHIYPMLNQLLREGLIRQHQVDRRKVYSITPEGKEALYQWLLEPDEPQPPRSELLLKLFLGGSLPREKVLALLEAFRSRHETRLKQYRAMESGYRDEEENRKSPEYEFLLAPLRYGIHASEAALRWCEETIKSLDGPNNGREDTHGEDTVY